MILLNQLTTSHKLILYYNLYLPVKKLGIEIDFKISL